MIKNILSGVLLTVLIVAYPLIVYYFLVNDLPLLGAGMVLLIGIWKLKQRDDWLVWAAAILALAVLIGYLLGPGFISKLSPLFIHISLFYLFGTSLRSTPLIEQFARLDFPELPPGIAEYCRGLTKVWTGFFALNIVGCLWLAVYGDNKFWALYNGIFVYVLIGLLVVGEYIWRRIRFPDLEIPPFRQTVENMIKNGHQIWAKDDAQTK